jgi:hypothetical protein
LMRFLYRRHFTLTVRALRISHAPHVTIRATMVLSWPPGDLFLSRHG